MVKILRLKGDITPKIASSFKDSIAIDTEATGLKIPERDKLSLIQICGESGDVYLIQPDRKKYNAPNLVSLLENKNILSSINKSFSLIKNNIGLIVQFIAIMIFMGFFGLFFPLLFFGLIPFWTILYIQIYLKISRSYFSNS